MPTYLEALLILFHNPVRPDAEKLIIGFHYSLLKKDFLLSEYCAFDRNAHNQVFINYTRGNIELQSMHSFDDKYTTYTYTLSYLQHSHPVTISVNDFLSSTGDLKEDQVDTLIKQFHNALDHVVRCYAGYKRRSTTNAEPRPRNELTVGEELEIEGRQPLASEEAVQPPPTTSYQPTTQTFDELLLIDTHTQEYGNRHHDAFDWSWFDDLDF